MTTTIITRSDRYPSVCVTLDDTRTRSVLAGAVHGIVSTRTIDEVDRMISACLAVIGTGPGRCRISIPGERASLLVVRV